jgi:hypothetical protein
MEPFKTYDALINYHKLVAVSDDHDITDPVHKVERKTYYHSTTDYKGYGESVIATWYPELIRKAASNIRPWSEIDIVLVIANHSIDGGYAMRSEGAVYLSRQGWSDVDFIHVAAHESGHVVAKLGDEYITCDAYDPCDKHPNAATAAQVMTGDVPWKKYARNEGEVNLDGTLKLVHEYHQNCGGDRDVTNGLLAPGDLQRIGAFWGCMYTDPPDAPASCDAYQDMRGKDYYRPMSRCLMRARERLFCKVCEQEYGAAIVGAVRILVRIPRMFPNRPPFEEAATVRERGRLRVPVAPPPLPPE